ncbi:MAG: BREX-1 system adenine-specific DNA-methyltransferase PglX [Desulfuromonadales bacterium]|nr:BREX-1 system adenine-specific DNA-methyltransferase PglX [Desulfuromonadales bacterium]
METAKLKKFAQFARRSLIEQVSAKLKLVLDVNSAARRERAEAIKKLEEAIKGHGKEQVIERVAYIWFNRFCALRFMDVNRHTRIGVVSPAEGQFQPEILAEAKMGHVDDEMVDDKVRQQIFALLEGKSPSRDPQGEAFRLLVVATCNYWNKAMPFLFQRIDDFTELLMPDDLLSGNSILAYTREAMTSDACADVEVIGWLYQFYISEKKDEVFDGLKKNKKITPENIPAATQLFTPHWIVRYLVENSLGRLWLLNRPGSKLVEQMDYYIKPEQAETDFMRIGKPEEIKICDPACGSGHMLTYAFDLLYAIYEEEGYEPVEIPEKILTNNLYGIEIDERAGELAAFALTMKARTKQRRFFNKGVKPNICVLENVHFDGIELKEYMDFVGRDLFTAPLQTTLRQFEEADNFGSLIRPDVTDVDGMLKILESKSASGQLFISMTHQKVLQALRQAEFLSPKYHVVIANPPYMGSVGMNESLRDFAKANYPDSKTDSFSMFMERCLKLSISKGFTAMINLPSWLFLSSFARLREKIIDRTSIESLLHMGRGIFGIDWGSTAFVLCKKTNPDKVGRYYRLHKRNFQHIYADHIGELFLCSKNNEQFQFNFDAYRDGDGVNFSTKGSQEGGQKIAFSAKSVDFKKVPGSPIAYWLPDALRGLFDGTKIFDAFDTEFGIKTGNNDRFLRFWYEVPIHHTNISESGACKFIKHNKGGDYRKWFGNISHVIDWAEPGKLMNVGRGANLSDYKSYLNGGVTWAEITSRNFCTRILEPTNLSNNKGPVAVFDSKEQLEYLVSLTNNVAYQKLAQVINPTLSFPIGDFSKLPFPSSFSHRNDLVILARQLIGIAKTDWNAYETSWDFTGLQLLNPEYHQQTLKATFQKLRTRWREMTLEMQRLEEENNRIFIEAYDLQDELKPEVSLNEITLTCNPHYRYGNDKSEEELEAMLLADTMRELVSYAVGCMFGRYALDKPGLILANLGEALEDYLKRVPEPSFPADDDNVIPMLDGDWFTDDIAERFRKFLRVAFGDEHYEENLRFVEKALGKNGKARDIRDYFLKDFYSDHVRRYKKRPIYWLFSSPKGSFNALIYMHRYRADTVSVVLNDYLREFRTKLTSHKNHLEAVSISASSSQGEKTKALKEIEKITRMITEMEEYEREVLYPLATEQVEIDLDEGVKVNYPKLGAALKKIVGLDAADE